MALAPIGCAQDEPALEGSPEPTAATALPTQEAASPGINDRGTETFTTETFELDLELDDFYFEPTFIKSPGAASASIELKNEGTVAHTFTAPDLGIDEELEPGTSKAIDVQIGTETRYEFYCRFHRDQGMQGAFQPH
jgi:plastocyanin